jgi:hypothetical protein
MTENRRHVAMRALFLKLDEPLFSLDDVMITNGIFYRIIISRPNSCLLGMGSFNLSFLPVLAHFVHKKVQSC